MVCNVLRSRRGYEDRGKEGGSVRGRVAGGVHICKVMRNMKFHPAIDQRTSSYGVEKDIDGHKPCIRVFTRKDRATIGLFVRGIHAYPPGHTTVLGISRRVLSAGRGCPSFSVVRDRGAGKRVFVSPSVTVYRRYGRRLCSPGSHECLRPFVGYAYYNPQLAVLSTLPCSERHADVGRFPVYPRYRTRCCGPRDEECSTRPIYYGTYKPRICLVGASSEAVSVGNSSTVARTEEIVSRNKVMTIGKVKKFRLYYSTSGRTTIRLLEGEGHHPTGPFTIVTEGLRMIRDIYRLDGRRRRVLAKRRGPVLLLIEGRVRAGRLYSSITPNGPGMKIVLPCTPIRLLLFRCPSKVGVPSFLMVADKGMSNTPVYESSRRTLRRLSRFYSYVLSRSQGVHIETSSSIVSFCGGEPCVVHESEKCTPLPIRASKG